MNYEIFFPTLLEEIDPFNDNIDVCLKLDNGKEYTIVVATPENLNALMNNEGASYIEPGPPFAIVKIITKTNIENLIDKLVEDDVLLQIYGRDLSELKNQHTSPT